MLSLSNSPMLNTDRTLAVGCAPPSYHGDYRSPQTGQPL